MWSHSGVVSVDFSIPCVQAYSLIFVFFFVSYNDLLKTEHLSGLSWWLQMVKNLPAMWETWV